MGKFFVFVFDAIIMIKKRMTKKLDEIEVWYQTVRCHPGKNAIKYILGLLVSGEYVSL